MLRGGERARVLPVWMCRGERRTGDGATAAVAAAGGGSGAGAGASTPDTSTAAADWRLAAAAEARDASAAVTPSAPSKESGGGGAVAATYESEAVRARLETRGDEGSAAPCDGDGVDCARRGRLLEYCPREERTDGSMRPLARGDPTAASSPTVGWRSR